MKTMRVHYGAGFGTAAGMAGNSAAQRVAVKGDLGKSVGLPRSELHEAETRPVRLGPPAAANSTR